MVKVLILLAFLHLGIAAIERCPTDNRYYLFKGMCYYVEKQYRQVKTWHDSDDYCKQTGGRLVSISSPTENTFLVDLIKSSNPYGGVFWIGLHGLGADEEWKWLDGTGYTYANFQNGDKIPDQEKCVSINRRGFWSPAHCSKTNRPICKKSPTATSTPPITPTTSEPKGNCPSEWIPFGGKCYLFRGNDSRSTMEEALKQCKNARGDLVSIHSELENAFITSNIGDLDVGAWIGIRQLQRNKFGWSDNSNFNFRNFAQTYPSSSQCGEIINSITKAGKWNMLACNMKRGYICQRLKDENIKPPPKVETICDQRYPGSFLHRKACYKVVLDRDKRTTWQNAEAECVKQGGHLASISNPFDDAFFTVNVNTDKEIFWIGLTNENNGRVFKWTDNWPVEFINWAKDQPSAGKNDTGSCVSFNGTNGEWSVTPCNTVLPYVCKFTDEKPPEQPEEHFGSCPKHVEDDWIDIGTKYCYLIKTSPSWNSGNAYLNCLYAKATLASFHSFRELTSLAPYFKDSVSDLWIGLTQKHDGGYEWLDGTPLDFENWGPGEPNSNVENCVEMRPFDLTWNDNRCNVYRGYICSIEKEKIPVELEVEKVESNSGSVAGLTILGILVAVMAGAVGYFLYREGKFRSLFNRKPLTSSNDDPQSITTSDGPSVLESKT